MRRSLTLVASVLALGSVGASAAHADAFKPSKKDQLSLGKRAAAQIRKEEKMVPDTDARVKLMREVAAKLLAADPTPKPEPWEHSFDLIDRPKELNAFALPGGPIFFYSGLMDKFTTEDQLAGVLAHEIMHVRKEHWAYAYADSQKRALGLAIVFSIFDVGRTAADLASISNELLVTTKFSRRHESEADDMGYSMMVKAGYNPQGMADAFRILKASSKGGKIPEWASTHPDIDRRIKAIEARIVKSQRSFPTQRPTPWAQPQ